MHGLHPPEPIELDPFIDVLYRELTTSPAIANGQLAAAKCLYDIEDLDAYFAEITNTFLTDDTSCMASIRHTIGLAMYISQKYSDQLIDEAKLVHVSNTVSVRTLALGRMSLYFPTQVQIDQLGKELRRFTAHLVAYSDVAANALASVVFILLIVLFNLSDGQIGLSEKPSFDITELLD